MTKILFISDFYLDEILGGGEKNNDAFLNIISNFYKVEKISLNDIFMQAFGLLKIKNDFRKRNRF